MPKIRKTSIFIALLFLFSFSFNVYAATRRQKNAHIARNCESLRESIRSVQKSDIAARTYLGSVYDDILNNFIKPINVRLLKNETKNDKLTKNQESFIKARQAYHDDFTVYSRSIEDLLKIDCKNNPEDFYSQLEIARTDREYVKQDVEKMNELIETQKDLVKDLKGCYE